VDFCCRLKANLGYCSHVRGDLLYKKSGNAVDGEGAMHDGAQPRRRLQSHQREAAFSLAWHSCRLAAIMNANWPNDRDISIEIIC